MKSAKIVFGGIGGDPYRFRLKQDSFGEGNRNLKFIPALQLDLMFHGDVEAKDCGSRFESQQYGTLFGDIAWTARSINGERRVFSASNIPHQLSQCPEAPSRAGAARGAETKPLDTLRDAFAVQILTGHDNNAAIPPVVRRRKNAAVPESEDGAMTGLQNGIVVVLTDRAPADGPTDRCDREVSSPSNQSCLEALRRRERSSAHFGLHRAR